MKKILVLLAVGAVAGCVLAQVYSQNVVGYVKVELAPGFSQIRTPFLDGPDDVDIQDLMDTSGLTSGTALAGADNLVFWDSASSKYISYFLHSGGGKGNADKAGKWVDSDVQIASRAIAPDEGFFFVKAGDSAVEVVLMGEVVVAATGTNQLTLVEGFNMIANPFASEWLFNDGSMDWVAQGAIAGTALAGADNLVFWDSASSKYVSYFLHSGGGKGNADKAGKWVDSDVQIAVGLAAELPQGFFYSRVIGQGPVTFEIEQPYKLD